MRSLRVLLTRIPGAVSGVSVLLALELYLPAQTPNGADRLDTASTTVTKPAYSPMTETQRLRDFLKNTTSPLSLVSSAASAGIGHWRDRPHEWKQGGDGYGLRYGSSYAEHLVRETMIFGVSSVFHEDNRYVRSGRSGFGSRVGYALGSTFLARSDDGTRRLSLSRIGAFAGAALVSRLWQPRSSASLRSAGVNFGTSIGVAVGFEVARELWPRK